MTTRPRRIRLMLALTPLALGTEARAQTTIAVPSNGSVFLCFAAGPDQSAPRSCGQSFTVPTTDNVLQSFSFLAMAAQKPVTFGIVAMSGGNLVGAPLFTAAVAPTGDTGFAREIRTFVPPGGLALTSGAMYAAVIMASFDPGVAFESNNTNRYPAGEIVLCDGSGACSTTVGGPGDPFDVAFRATFGTSGVVTPEPQTLALLGTGLLVLGTAASRRRV